MAPIETNEKAEAEEEHPLVKDLKEIDDKYLALKREFEKEQMKLIIKYTEMQKPLLTERQKVLDGDGGESGTPGCEGFWLKCLENHPLLQDEVQEWDKPVLKYLKEIDIVNLDPDDTSKGFRIRFVFAPNPYFTNATLSKEVHLAEGCPYREEIDCIEVRGCKVDWKPGKDVTVEKVKAKPAKKGKKVAAAKEEARPSFFRSTFRSLKKGDELGEEEAEQALMELGEMSASQEDLLAMILEQEGEMGSAIKEQIVPFAVRWYTGEATPEDAGGDSDDEGEEEEDDDDDDEDDSEDDSPKGKGKGKGKKGGGYPKAKQSGDDNKKEECKQQ